MKPTRLFPTFLISGLVILLIGFNINCGNKKEIENPYNPIPDPDPNPTPTPQPEQVTVEYTGEPITARTLRWEMTLESITITETLPSNWYPGHIYKARGKFFIVKLKVKNIIPPPDPWHPVTLYNYIGDTMFKLESSLGYKYTTRDYWELTGIASDSLDDTRYPVVQPCSK